MANNLDNLRKIVDICQVNFDNDPESALTKYALANSLFTLACALGEDSQYGEAYHAGCVAIHFYRGLKNTQKELECDERVNEWRNKNRLQNHGCLYCGNDTLTDFCSDECERIYSDEN